MSTFELREAIHENLDKIDDEEFLETLHAIVTSRDDSWSESSLPAWQRTKLERSEQQIREGKFKFNEEVFKNVDRWLKK
jgi:hypothetical protein